MNKRHLIEEILWYNNIKKKIFTNLDLANICKAMPNNYFEKLLENIWKKRILKLFLFEKDFYNFLLSIPQSKEKIFINFLRNQ